MHYEDMIFSGVIQLAQKAATQHGACSALVSFWKNSMGSYHEMKKVCQYMCTFVRVKLNSNALLYKGSEAHVDVELANIYKIG